MGLDISLKDVTVIGTDSVSTKPSVWYEYGYRFDRWLSTVYEQPNIPFLFRISLDSIFYDQYLVIDGQMMWFIDDAYGEYHYDWNEEDIVEEDGTPAKVYTFSVWNVFYGKKFSATGIVTVYQLKSSQQAAPITVPTQQNRHRSPLQPMQSYARQKTYAPTGQYRYGFISGGDFHGRGKGPRPFTADDDLRSVIRQQQVKIEMK